MDSSGHQPVLAEQVLSALSPHPGQVYLDCTAGRGGHAALIAPRLSPGGRVILLDADPGNLLFARDRVREVAGDVAVDAVHGNFAAARAALNEVGVARVDLLLADLGFASNQMDDPARGFSFNADGPLDMRLDPTGTTTAADLVNRLPERELADLIFEFGEERLSRRIAKKIVENRAKQPIETTLGLARIVREAYGHGGPKHRIDPATRTFMALRIAVNGELEALDCLLGGLSAILSRNGRAAVISFHSLEDRRVKQGFASLEQEGAARRLTRKPMVADEAEQQRNPRSRSAKLRAIEFVAGGG